MTSSLIFSIVSYVVNSSWEIPLIAATAWAVIRLQKRIGPRVQHIIWVVTLALAILTPAWPLCRKIIAYFSFPHPVGGHTSIALATAQSVGDNAKQVLILPAVVILILFSCYLCTLLYFAARFVWSLYWTASLHRDSLPLSLNPEQNELWSRCKHTFSVGVVSFRSSRRVHGPVTIGFGRAALLLPAGFSDRCTSHDFLAAIGHEGAHIRRRDFHKNLLYEAVSLVIAFHPVTWLLKSQIAQTREMICDAMAVEGLISSHDYTQSLLRLASMIVHGRQVTTTHAIGIFDANILEKRIMYMTRKKQTLTLAMRLGLIIPGALLLGSAAAGGAVTAISIEPQAQPSQSASQVKAGGEAYRVGGDVSAPMVIWAPDPAYPKSALKGKGTFQGICVVKTIVNASGIPTDVQIVRSLRPDFDASAIKAVQQYRFSPAIRSGVPVPVTINIEVNFKKY
jgi:TonB family protein